MSQNVLDALKHNSDHNLFKLTEVIKFCLTTRPSPVTWETVIGTIESPIVNCNSEADIIRHYLRGKSIRVIVIKLFICFIPLLKHCIIKKFDIPNLRS